MLNVDRTISHRGVFSEHRKGSLILDKIFASCCDLLSSDHLKDAGRIKNNMDNKLAGPNMKIEVYVSETIQQHIRKYSRKNCFSAFLIKKSLC